MGFFDFLETAKKGVGAGFSFLSGGIPGVQQQRMVQKQKKDLQKRFDSFPLPQQQKDDIKSKIETEANKVINPANTARNLGVAVARAPLRGGLTIGTTIGDAITPGDQSTLPRNRLIEAVAGKEPIESIPKRIKGTEKELSKKGIKGATPLAFLGVGLSLGGDVVPIGAGKKQLIEQATKEMTETGIRSILKKAGMTAGDDIVRALANNKDKNIAKNLLDKVVDIKTGTKVLDSAPQVGKTVPETPSMVPKPNIISDIKPSLAEATVPGKQRGFLETLQKSDNTTPELKTELGKLPQKYTPAGEQVAYTQARQIVEADPEKVLADTMGKTMLSRQEGANGLELLSKLQREGKIDSANTLAEHLDNVFREHGQASQVAALWDRMTPEGILRQATRKVRQGREKQTGYIWKKGVEEEPAAAKRIKEHIEGATTVSKKSVDDIVASVAKGEDLSTGAKVAKRIEKEVTPQVKKKADILVQELTKKIKQESLAPKTVVKKSPTSILREVFGRYPEAREAYPEAQRILRDRFADNPKVLEVLDKFFQSELKLPAASSTIDNAIREQLLKKSAKVSEIIHKSWSAQKQSVDDVAKALVNEGFDASSAKQLAEEVTTRLNKQLADAKIKVLERMSIGAPKRAQTTYLNKIEKLSNAGALDNHDYLQLARNELGLADLSDDAAKEISTLAQQMQNLPMGYEKFQLIKKIQEKIASQVPKTIGGTAKEVLSSSKSLLASYDISGGGRQAAALGTRFPKVYGKAMKNQLSYFKSQEAFDRSMADHALSKNADIYADWKVDWADPMKTFKEEAFQSQLPEKIPFAGAGVRGSNRAFTGLLADERLGVVDEIVKHFDDAGMDVRQWPESWKTSMGKYINTFSGRGTGKPGGVFEKWSPFLNETLFSPKLWKSRLDMLNPLFYARLKGPARKLALQNAGSFAGVASAILGTAYLLGAEVETDARSSDFLKIKVGDTRYDILGGFQQNLVFAWREISGEKKSSQSGRVTKLDSGGFGMANRISVLSDLIENKSNPVIGLAKTQITGMDKAGNKLTPMGRASSLLSAVLPLNIQDTYSTYKDTGSVPETLLKATIPGTIGVGVGTYGIKDINISKGQKEYIQKLETKGVPKDQIEASTRLFQTIKSGPSRDDVGSEIKKALGTKPTQVEITKAREIAKAYNKKYNDNFKTWLEQYPSYTNDPDLLKAYRQGLMTDATISRYISNIGD